ncbi:MAG: hypothetical protein M1812_002923 [Candelaria pacifica]|nr:MAG: hypothetical protein M1812_002923 [Candelaria pacifica]
MFRTIEDLPFELLSYILNEAAELNSHDAATYTYGLSEAPQPLRQTTLQRYVRGRVAPDVLKWNASSALRQVNQRWHDWALDYSLKDLYIRRWRGSEKWMESRNLADLPKRPSGIAVYRDSFCALRKSVQLFSTYPDIASYVRRVWFDGFRVAETDNFIFQVLRNCRNVRSATLPWTTLRHVSAEDWSLLLQGGQDRQALSSLELLAVDLKSSQTRDLANLCDVRPLDVEHGVDFSSLKRLKIFGNTNLLPITDSDLKAIARTAKNLKAIHLTGLSSITIDGVMALVEASKDTLGLLEYSPLSDDGFDHPDPSTTSLGKHLCPLLLDCPRLENVSISVPSICAQLFSKNTVRWSGELQIRAGTTCGQDHIVPSSINAQDVWRVLNQARALMDSRHVQGAQLDIEIFISHWIFEPRHNLVHGNFDLAEAISEFTWPSLKASSGKGPYGQTGLYGKVEGPYDCISEASFSEGLHRGYISF